MPDPVDDEEFEDFLRQFEPRAPSPLPFRRPARSWWALAAAALIAVGFYAVRHHGPLARYMGARHDTVRSNVARSRPTLGEVSVILRPRDHDRVMAELEADVLADPRRRGGALRALADR